ncbi:MAG: DUF4105 domain-containing protein, partial [Elusimicrobiota bacterium]|nr:DUF4105 domain-containing protein [Elusimicrobiota bacterium]
IIEKILPPDTLENTASSEYIKSLQRDAEIISKENNIYTLTNIAWEMKHNAEGDMALDEYGNPITLWRSEVKIDMSKVKNVYFGKKTSLKPIRYGNHGVLMVTFEPGGVIAPDGSQIGSLAFSVDAYYTDPTQMVYSMLEALKGKYQVYYSIYSADCYSELKFNYNEFNMSNNMVVVPYPLLLNKEEKMLLLRNAIRKATDNNAGEMYSVIYNSCANSILSIINSALPEKRKIKTGWLPEFFYRLKTSLPGAMAALLVKKDVADKPLPDITPNNYVEYLKRLAPGATIRK